MLGLALKVGVIRSQNFRAAQKLGSNVAMPADDSSLCSYFFFSMLQLICELFSVIMEAGPHKEPSCKGLMD